MTGLQISISNTIKGALPSSGGIPPIETRFIFTVKTDNPGSSADNQFTIPTSTSGITQAFLYDIETSDGQSITGLTGNHTITFPTAGTYEVKISGSFPYMYFNFAGDRFKLLDIKNLGIYGLGSTIQDSAFRGCTNLVISATDVGYFGDVTSFGYAFRGCTSITSFPLIDTSSATNLLYAWEGCTSLTSFPLLNTSSVTTFSYAFRNCTLLTSFPLIDTSSGISFLYAWESCRGLISFPLLNTSSGTSFNFAWRNCTLLTSFPLIDTSGGTSFFNTWNNCTSLTSFPLLNTSSSTSFSLSWYNCASLTSFPANAFDNSLTGNYTNAFSLTNLTTQSIDNILVSLDTSGLTNGTFRQSGGQAPSATGLAARDNLVSKFWTVVITA